MTTTTITQCESDYEHAITTETVFVDGCEIGDVVNFDGRGALELSTNWAVILTATMRPYSNGRFATRA